MSQNAKNLQRLEPLGVIAEVVNEGRIIRTRLPGRMLGLPASPDTFDDDSFDPATANKPANERLFRERDDAGAAVSRGFLAVGHAVKSVTEAHAQLRPEVARKASAEAATASLTVLGAEYAKLQPAALTLQAKRAALYAVPEADTGGTVVDSELRSHFRSLSLGDQAVMLAKLERPEYSRLLIALKRSPLPHTDATASRLQDAWTAHVDATRPEESNALAAETANHEWATGVLKQLAKAVTEGRTMTPPAHSTAAVDIAPMDAYRAVRGNGEGVLGLSNADRAVYERRAEIEKAAAQAAGKGN